VAREVADAAVEILDRVRGAQRAIERAGDAEALEREGLLEPFAQGGGRAHVRALEAGGQLLESALHEGRVVERLRFVEHPPHARPHRLREMLQDMTAGDEGRRPARLAQRLAKAGPAVDHEEDRAGEMAGEPCQFQPAGTACADDGDLCTGPSGGLRGAIELRRRPVR
jgi:hypothetical protein